MSYILLFAISALELPIIQYFILKVVGFNSAVILFIPSSLGSNVLL